MPEVPPLLPVPRRLRLGGRRVTAAPASLAIDRAAGLPAQGYRLTVADGGVSIIASDEAGAFYGTQTLRQLRSAAGAGPLQECEVVDWPDVPTRGVMLDVSRDKVPTMATLEALVDRLASWKINHLQLYMEHTFAHAGHEAVWRDASPFTPEEIDRLDAHCRARHIELSANQNTLGHMERWLRHDRYRPLAIHEDGFEMSGRRLPAMTMDPSRPAALALAREMLGGLVPHFTSPRVHVGLDEPWELPPERFDDYVEYIRRLRHAPELDGREMLIWGDIVASHPASLSDLPPGVTICDWGYEAAHPSAERGPALAASGHPFWVCPGTSSWNSVMGRGAVARPNIAGGAAAATAHGAEGLLVTDWGDNGHLQYLPVSEPWLAYAGAVSWCGATNDGIDLAAAVDAHVFHDPSRGLGGAILALAGLHARVDQPWPNASVVTANLYWPGLRIGEGRTAGVTDEALAAVLDQLADARRSVRASVSERADAALVREELESAAALVEVLVTDQRARLAAGGRLDGVDASVRRNLAARLGDIADEHRRLWLARNRPGGLEDSLGRLYRLRDLYLA